MKKYILKNKWLALAYLMMSLISSGMTVYLSIILRDIVDVALSLNLDGFYQLLMTSSIFFVLLGVVQYLKEALYAGVVAKILRHVRADVFDGIMKQEMAQFESVNSADYMSALTNDVKLLEDNYFRSLALVSEQIAIVIIATGFMIYFSWQVASGLFGTLIALIIVPVLFGSAIRKRQTRLSQQLSLFTVKIKDIFSGFEVVKSYQMSAHIKKSFEEHNDKVIKSNFSFHHINAILGAVSSLIGLFLQIGVVFFSAWLIISGHLTAGSLVGLLIVAGQITGPVQMLGHMIPMIKGSQEIIDRLIDFTMRESSYQGTQVGTFNDEIKIEGLSFTYPDQEEAALKHLNVIFKKNKKYVLVGKSGCGKTTLAKAVMGYLNDYEGNILYDETELKQLDTQFYEIPTMVHQRVYMFDETVEENIHLHKTYEKEALHLAVEQSGVSLFLNDERTLKTKVGENGSNLSGGERQRIAVARALIQNKPLLILDEGTSAVDKQTAVDIESRLLAREDLTLLTITHTLDPDLLCKYDEVIYMENGRIIENGPYERLMASEGKFNAYVRS